MKAILTVAIVLSLLIASARKAERGSNDGTA